MLDFCGFVITSHNFTVYKLCEKKLVCIAPGHSHRGGHWPFVYVDEPSDMVPAFCVSWS